MSIRRAHGGGGRETDAFIRGVVLARLEDAARVPGAEEILFSTDSFVVSPLFFPGGDIGKLAACGTLNDIAVRGGIPRYLSLALVIEEGTEEEDVARILESVAAVCRGENVSVVCGDTKVVERGKGDGVFITTAGVGVPRPGVDISVRNLRPGDAVLVSGTVGEHGVALLGARKELHVTSDIVSDCACLAGLVECMLNTGAEIHAMRDATRGGVAAVVNEMGTASGVTVVVEEERVPVDPRVRGACELLGMDPLDIANEGKLVAAVKEDDAGKVLEAMHAHPLGRGAAVIGRVEPRGRFPAVKVTPLGSRTILEMPRGELLPRIC